MKTISPLLRIAALCGAISVISPHDLQAGAISGVLYYTRYQSPAEVKKVTYSYDGASNFILTNATSIVALPGADGLTVAADGDLIVGGCGNGIISKVNPLTGSYVSKPSGGGACHLALDPTRTRAWAGFTYSGSTALSEIPLNPFANGIPHTITGDDTAVGTLAWDRLGNCYYTLSQPSGIGSFGYVNLTTFTTKRLLSNVNAAHGMSFDPFSGTFILFGDTHITQVTATPTSAVILGDLNFAGKIGSDFDQGTVDGRGHIFAAENSGNMAFLDYSASGNITNASTFVAIRYLDSYLDDVAPVGLVGSGGVADLSLTATLTPNPALVRSNLVLRFTAANAGPSNATHITLSQKIPDNVELVSYTSSAGAFSLSQGTLGLVVPSLAAKSSVTAEVVLRPISGPVEVHALLLADETDTYFPDNRFDAVIPAPYACVPPLPGMVAFWPGENNFLDAVTTNHGTLSTNVTFASGISGSAFSFDGNTSALLVPDSATLRPASVTAECWVNYSVSSGVRQIFGKAYGSGDADSFVLWTDNNTLHGYVQFNNGSAILSYPWVPTPGVWYHLAYTFDPVAKVHSLYLNGQLVVSDVANGAIVYDTHPLSIGADYANNVLAYRFWGLIDEPALYNRALTAAEIRSIYNANAASKCGPINITPSPLAQGVTNVPYAQSLSLTHASPVYSFALASGSLPPGITLTKDGLLSGIPTQVGNYTFSIKGTDALGATVTTPMQLPILACQVRPLGMLGWWRGEGNGADELGQHPGTLQGSVVFGNGRVGKAFQLDGSSAYVDLGAWSPGSRWTLEAWFNSIGLVGGRRTILGSMQECRDWGLVITDGRLGLQIKPPGGCSDILTSDVWPVNGTWYHVVGTCDGSTARIYVNGTLRGQRPVEPNYIGTTLGTRIGSGVCCGELAPELIDEAAIYNRALADTEVLALYNMGAAGKCTGGAPPTLSFVPSNFTASPGDPVTYPANATGTGPFSWQWYLNGVPVPGATSPTLTIPHVQTNQAGIYTVSVGNVAGTVQSPGSTLTVMDIGILPTLIINGLVGRNYRIDYQDTFTPPNTWINLTTVTVNATPYLFVDNSALGKPKRFYRAVIQ